MQPPTNLGYLDVPPRRPAAGPPPLLIMLHGVGSNEADLVQLAPALDPHCHVVSLRAPYTLEDGSYAWFHVVFTASGPQHVAAEAEASRALLRDKIPALVAATGADPARVYLLGFSQGAIMSLLLALTDPAPLAGVIAMSGRGLAEIETRLAPPAALTGLPIFVTHGLYDTVLPIAYGRALQALLARLPVALTYREYPMAHEISRESLQDAAAWLTARLDAPPRPDMERG